mmetsp:Transcript_67543/g.162155  ORF Transcript_67543/g.162155 Transcript_67543/m.162155 type:complete len:239 (+) Transcript_67543:153-869(+)
MQKAQADTDLQNMQDALQKSLRREQKAPRGVLIRQACYGNLRLRQDRTLSAASGATTITIDDLVGPVQDVAVPMQCLVEKHSIILPGGSGTSKSDLPGFYHPDPLDIELELSLYVLYEFRGAMHEVTIGDKETLRVPSRSHLIQPGSKPRGPFAACNVELFRNTEAEDPSTKQGMSTMQGHRASRRGRSSSLEAFEDSVIAYRRYMLLSGDIGAATPKEFKAVMTVALVTAIVWQFMS